MTSPTEPDPAPHNTPTPPAPITAVAPCSDTRLAWLGLWSMWTYAPATFAALRAWSDDPSEALFAPPDAFESVQQRKHAAAHQERLRATLGLAGRPSLQLRQRALDALLSAGRAQRAGLGASMWIVDAPRLLVDLRPAPPFLYGWGTLEALGELPARGVAIVGSRDVAQDALDAAHAVATHAANAGFSVVSGGALGIDAAAHLGALDAGGVTVAVLGAGLDRLYPRAHAPLFARIAAASGAVVTPFALGQHVQRHHFPRRNALIAALARALVVVRARDRSGSLITASLAQRLGRPIFALPAAPDARDARGSNALLKRGDAHALSAPDALPEALAQHPIDRADARPTRPQTTQQLALLSRVSAPQPAHTPATHHPAPSTPPTLSALSPQAQAHLSALLRTQPHKLDALTRALGVHAGALSAALLTWEISGHVTRAPGGFYAWSDAFF